MVSAVDEQADKETNKQTDTLIIAILQLRCQKRTERSINWSRFLTSQVTSESTGVATRPNLAIYGFQSKKGSPYLITERRVPELILVLGSQPAGDVSHKTGGRLPLFSARPAVTPATLKRAATNFAAW